MFCLYVCVCTDEIGYNNWQRRGGLHEKERKVDNGSKETESEDNSGDGYVWVRKVEIKEEMDRDSKGEKRDGKWVCV